MMNAVIAKEGATKARNEAVAKAEALAGMVIANAIDNGDFKAKVKVGNLAVAKNLEGTLRNNGYNTKLRTGHNAHFVSVYWENPTVY